MEIWHHLIHVALCTWFSYRWLNYLLLFISDFQHEPWFGSRYVEEDIPQDLIELWRNPQEIDASLHLPSKNEFIPSDFSIRAGGACDGDFENSTSPRCIVDEALIKFWYKLDSTFRVPRANTYFRINLKGGYDNAKSCVLSELFIHLLKDELNEIIYQVNHLFFFNKKWNMTINENRRVAMYSFLQLTIFLF